MYDDYYNQQNSNNVNGNTMNQGTSANSGDTGYYQGYGNMGSTNNATAGNNANTGTNGGVYSGNPSYETQNNRTYNYSSRYPNNFTSATDNSRNYNSGTGSAQTYGQMPNQAAPKPKKKKGGFKKVLACAGLGICFGVCAGLSFYAVDAVTGRTHGDTELTASADTAVAEVETEENKVDKVQLSSDSASTVTAVVSDVSEVVDKAMPAMVSIVNTYTENFSYFGRDFSQEENASGSGIIVGENDTELLIVTNYHVVQGAEELAVSFVDGAVASAQIKGTDSSMDLAVIAISLEDLSKETLENIAVAQLGDSESLKLGEPVIAIGNALGYGQSVTTGVVSALDREIAVSDSSSGTFIQTNAAINPGNSGGALLNIKGEVIGINSNKIGGSAIEGMGYAIPISSAKPIIEELMNRETKTKVDTENKGYLGITGVTVTEDVASVYGMPEGVYVTQVYKGTGAEAAGIAKGCIITKLDGITISSMDDLIDGLEYYAIGDTVEVTIQQVVMQEHGAGEYEEKTVTVTLGTKVE